MPVQRVICKGDAYDVGYKHGTEAADKVKGSIAFYENMFKQYTGKSWAEIVEIALAFGRNIELEWPEYLEEMKGIADGANCKLPDILALNARTEIAFGLMDPSRLVTDGCTSLAWPAHGIMAQNWDWMQEQSANIIFLTIERIGKPVIKMMTEAGIIGKIGANSAGVGVLLNAVRCIGNDMRKMPLHLALRAALDSETLEEAVEILSRGIGGSGFVLIGQGKKAVGLEMTSRSVQRLVQDRSGCIIHSNHLIMQHDDAKEWPEGDSFDRLKQLQRLAEGLASGVQIGEDDVLGMFDDHDGFPMSICRAQEGASMDATLFNIFMDLERKRVRIRMGRICEPSEIIDFEL